MPTSRHCRDCGIELPARTGLVFPKPLVIAVEHTANNPFLKKTRKKT